MVQCERLLAWEGRHDTLSAHIYRHCWCDLIQSSQAILWFCTDVLLDHASRRLPKAEMHCWERVLTKITPQWRLAFSGFYNVEFKDFWLGDMASSQGYALSVWSPLSPPWLPLIQSSKSTSSFAYTRMRGTSLPDAPLTISKCGVLSVLFQPTGVSYSVFDVGMIPAVGSLIFRMQPNTFR